MMAAQHHYVYTGEGKPPRNATHVRIHDSITIIPRQLFCGHPNIVELICHDGVIKVEAEAFYDCALKWLVMPGVKEVEYGAFLGCDVEHVKCQKLEIIGKNAFYECKYLKSIDLSSAKIVSDGAFDYCFSLADVKFGRNLESIGKYAFSNAALKQIAVPLKSGLFAHGDVFVGCKKLSQVFLIEEASLHETSDALLLDEWKSDLFEEIDSINQILPNADAGINDDCEEDHAGEKTRVIREWIGRVLRRIIHFKAEHYRLLSLAAAAIAHASPYEIVIDSTISFLELPVHTFEGEGVDNATTPTFDKNLWENALQTKQRLLEKLENDTETASLMPQNDEKGINAQLEPQGAESGGVIAMKDAVGLSRKRPRNS